MTVGKWTLKDVKRHWVRQRRSNLGLLAKDVWDIYILKQGAYSYKLVLK